MFINTECHSAIVHINTLTGNVVRGDILTQHMNEIWHVDGPWQHTGCAWGRGWRAKQMLHSCFAVLLLPPSFNFLLFLHSFSGIFFICQMITWVISQHTAPNIPHLHTQRLKPALGPKALVQLCVYECVYLTMSSLLSQWLTAVFASAWSESVCSSYICLCVQISCMLIWAGRVYLQSVEQRRLCCVLCFGLACVCLEGQV